MADKGRNLNKLSTMRISTFVAVVVIVLNAVSAKYGPDKSVCSLDVYANRSKVDTGPKKPTLPKQWTVRIEGNIIEHNYTQDIQEFYDGLDNKGAVIQYVGGISTQLIFLYPTNELITLQFDNSGNPPRCHVDDLAKSTAKNVFGLTQFANGTEHIFSANQALRFGGKTPEVFIGQAEAHNGMTVDAWESCMYWDAQDATFHLTWYFSANNSWTSAINKVVPVELLINGIVHVNSSYSVNVQRQYIFTDFRPVLFYGPIGAFETPQGTYCRNRVSMNPLRNVTSMFTFTAEIFEPETSYINWIKEYYDYNMNLVRYDYTPDPGSGSQYGNNKLTRVHDFNTGTAYIMDTVHGNCSASTIDNLGFDDKSLDPAKLRMRTDKGFFYFDESTYVYSGQKVYRDIACHAWVIKRKNFPPGYPGAETIWEWCIADPGKWTDTTAYSFRMSRPISLRISANNPDIMINYNVYDYTEDDPKIWKTDVSACFDTTQQKKLTLSFPGDSKGHVTADIDAFKEAVRHSAYISAGISPLQITDVQVDFSGVNVIVTFTVLGSPNLPGGVNTTNPFVSLATAVSSLNNVISQGAFVITLPNSVSLHASMPAFDGIDGLTSGNTSIDEK